MGSTSNGERTSFRPRPAVTAGELAHSRISTAGPRVKLKDPAAAASAVPEHGLLSTTMWYHQADEFQVSLVTPSGQEIPVPALGQTDAYQASLVELELSAKPYSWSNAIQVQVSISCTVPSVPETLLRGWQFRITCSRAVVGRLDGWFHNSGFASFRDHPLLESHRTVGLPATGEGSLTVASHVSRNGWNADQGAMMNPQAVPGKSSQFSSLGPTRDGRWKPEISAPGQYVTAALADQSKLSEWDERALVNQQLVTIEGTSMAAPVISGVLALMLQKDPTLDKQRSLDILRDTALRDLHTGPSGWTPSYGFGKVNVAAALDRMP